MKKVLIFGHGSGINRGCEAIIRTVSDLIKSVSDAKVTVCAVDAAYDKTIDYKSIDSFIEYPRYKAKSISWILNKIDERFISGDKLSMMLSNKSLLNAIKESDLCISVGGDNYCYSDPIRYYAFDYFVKKYNKPLVMYGASIEPDMVKGKLQKDLERFDLIVTRESITYQALSDKIPSVKTVLYPDPAFTMSLKEADIPAGLEFDNLIGLNVSPLIMKYEQSSGVVYNAVYNLMDSMLEKYNRNILLVPHVTQKGNSDYDVLKKIYEKYQSTGKVFLLNDKLTAQQYKWFISKCRMFIGARTHSTIAAYSNAIPTFVIGYSVKARGIDKDIYNGKFDLLCPVQSIDNDKKLVQKYEEMEKNYDAIKAHLDSVIPAYRKKAFNGISELSDWLA